MLGNEILCLALFNYIEVISYVVACFRDIVPFELDSRAGRSILVACVMVCQSSRYTGWFANPDCLLMTFLLCHGKRMSFNEASMQ